MLPVYDSAAVASLRHDGRELWNRRSVLPLLVRRELRVRYQRSALGVWWTLLNPMLEMGVLLIVFSNVFRFSTPDAPYVVYLLSGLLIAGLVRTTVIAVGVSLSSNALLLTRMRLPAELFGLAKAVEMGVTFLVGSVVLLAIMVGFGPGLAITTPLALLPASLALVFALGIGLVLAPAAARFPDLGIITGILITLGTYLSPVFYPLSIVPDQYQWLVEANPLTTYIDGFRSALYAGSLGSINDLLLMAGMAAFSLAVGVKVFSAARQSTQVFLA